MCFDVYRIRKTVVIYQLVITGHITSAPINNYYKNVKALLHLMRQMTGRGLKISGIYSAHVYSEGRLGSVGGWGETFKRGQSK